MDIGFHATILPHNETCFFHSDNVYGDPSSLSDARLKTDLAEVTGEQALSVLSNIQGQTYWREDLKERRLGLVADQCQSALSVLAIDNVLGSKLVGEEQYKTLDYSRLVSLLIPAVNTLAARVQELEMTTTKKRKTNGTVSSKSS